MCDHGKHSNITKDKLKIISINAFSVHLWFLYLCKCSKKHTWHESCDEIQILTFWKLDDLKWISVLLWNQNTDFLFKELVECRLQLLEKASLWVGVINEDNSGASVSCIQDLVVTHLPSEPQVGTCSTQHRNARPSTHCHTLHFSFCGDNAQATRSSSRSSAKDTKLIIKCLLDCRLGKGGHLDRVK